MQPTDIRRVVELLRNDYVIKVRTWPKAVMLTAAQAACWKLSLRLPQVSAGHLNAQMAEVPQPCLQRDCTKIFTKQRCCYTATSIA